MGDGSSSSSSSSTPSSCLYSSSSSPSSSSSRSTSSIAPLGPTIDKTDNPEPDHNRQKRLGSDRIEGDGWTFGVGSGSSDHPSSHRRPSDRPRRRRRPHAQLQMLSFKAQLQSPSAITSSRRSQPEPKTPLDWGKSSEEEESHRHNGFG